MSINNFIAIIFLFVPCLGNAYIGSNLDNYSSQFLAVSRWDEQFDKDRIRDVNYLVGGVNGPLLEDLNAKQKGQISVWIREMAIRQLIRDRQEYRKYLVSEYSKFFILDELDKLTNYFKTELMQFIIQARINHKELTIQEIEEKIVNANNLDKVTIDSFTSSYLNSRYLRFQQSISERMDKMLIERYKIVMAAIMKRLPELIAYVKENKSSIDLELNVSSPM